MKSTVGVSVPKSVTAIRNSRIAWLGLLLFPLGFWLSLRVGEGIYSALGYESTSGPWWAKLVSAVPALVLMAAPALTATIWGRRAFYGGVRHARWPGLLGVVILIFVGTITLSSLIGLI